MTKTATPYKAYSGRNVDQLPLMLAQGVVPLPVVEFMLHRESIMAQPGDIYADTSDLPAYGGKAHSDQVKMILTVDNQGRITDLGRKALGLINPSQKRSGGAIVLTDELYDGLKGPGVIPLARNEVEGHGLDNRVWRILMRDPNEVPAEFAYDKAQTLEAVQRTMDGVRAKGLNNSMGVYLDSSGKHAKLRAWCVYGLVDGSDADGRYNLAYDSGRFLGIAPEALSAPVEATSEASPSQVVKSYSSADLQAFDGAVKGLEATVRPELLAPFAQLRKKL